MGDRWQLLLGERQIRDGKNKTRAKLMTVFREEDKYMNVDWVRQIDEWNAHAASEDGIATWDDIEGIEGPDTGDIFGYRTTVQTAIIRLTLMGFDPERCRRQLIDDLDERTDDGVLVLTGHPQGPLSRPRNEYKIAVEEVIDTGIEAYLKGTGLPYWDSRWSEEPHPLLTELEELCTHEVNWFFDHSDPRLFLGLILRSQDPQAVLQIDLSGLLSAGYLNSTEAVSTEALQQLRDETASSGPIIVITEGKFDSRVLGRALRIVRPDVAGYFTFWNLEETKAGGGTDRVVINLRSFAAAGVMNRVIALVDNDAAGLDALKKLANPVLPRNYVACKLPDLDYARSYPTEGPSGSGCDDINGRACSVEFYFGLDCLLGDDGQAVPVVWTSLNKSTRTWQGELRDKTSVQARIEGLLDAVEAGRTPLDERWNPFREIAEVLTEAATAPHSFLR
ncbi:hypothetical protein ACFRCG_33630 [Embleya sp. NPDC056575]|uniref:hypothetical protein n=1 Tax=unclassified Embleya TaxID=2699296 RepID=UPI0036886806